MTSFNRYAVLAGLPLLLLGIGFSPLNRYVYHSAGNLTYALKGEAAFDAYYGFDAIPSERKLADMELLGDWLKEHRQPGERIFAGSGMAGLIYKYADYIPEYRIYHSCFLIAPYAPDIWRTETGEYLLKTRPEFVVLHDDRMKPITGTDMSSREAIVALNGISELLAKDYIVAFEHYPFEIYRRSGAKGGETTP